MKLALGTAQFGQVYGVASSGQLLTQNEIGEILRVARKFGVQTIDTAIAYGESENCLGKEGLEQFQVVTKLPPIPSNCRNVANWVFSHVAESLRRLKVDQLHGLLLHRPSDLVGDGGSQLHRALLSLKETSRIAKWGVSVYSPQDLDAIATSYEPELVQVPLNVFDRRFIVSGWLSRMSDSGVEVHARSVFLQGILVMRQEMIPSYFDRWSVVFGQWRNWLVSEGLSPVEACIGFVKSVREVDKIVVGVDSAVQLAQLASAYMCKIKTSMPDFSINEIGLIDPSQWKRKANNES